MTICEKFKRKKQIVIFKLNKVHNMLNRGTSNVNKFLYKIKI